MKREDKIQAYMSTSYYRSRIISFDGEALILHLVCRFRMKEDQSTVNIILEEAQEYMNWKSNLFEISRITKSLDWKAIENLIFNELLDDKTKKAHSKSNTDSISDTIENQDDNWSS